MSDMDFEDEDLYGLRMCLRDLDEMLARAGEAETDKAVRYALIKTFELTYEMAVKTLRKYLIATTGRSDEAATFDYQDLIRLGDQENLLQTGWPEWKQYRTNRSRTVHTYGETVALQIGSQLPQFSVEIHVLLARLELRLEGHRER